MADANKKTLTETFRKHKLQSIEVFGSDGAVVGGRQVTNYLNQHCLRGLTDIVVDISALSVGTSFPIIRLLVHKITCYKESINLHLFVAHHPQLDNCIRAVSADTPNYIHGFKGRLSLHETNEAARLWLPLLAKSRRSAFRKLFDFVDPHDTCPVMPFPAIDPRLGDKLAEEYLTEFESAWMVDTRDIVYADEGDPLDLYRTILGLDEFRRQVFDSTGGSMLILSPLGNKVMSLGSLLAAIERNLPVAYLEAIGYKYDSSVSEEMEPPDLFHIWLEGEIYPIPRSVLPAL